MRSVLTAILILCLAGSLATQTGTSTQKSATTKPAAGTAAIPAKQPILAVFQTTAGDINCTLFPDKAPLTVNNFVGLATGTKDWKNPFNGATMHNRPLYDGTIFHRVIPNFMIQGGDPLGNGSGSPGFTFKDEFSDLRFDQPGRLAMANSGPNTNGSQFFITEVPTPHLDGKHTIFGQCENLDLVKQIARAPTDPRNDRPFNPVKITHLKIVNPNKPAATPAKKPATSTTTKKPASTTPKPQ